MLHTEHGNTGLCLKEKDLVIINANMKVSDGFAVGYGCKGTHILGMIRRNIIMARGHCVRHISGVLYSTHEKKVKQNHLRTSMS